MSQQQVEPSHIMQVGMGFWASKTVLSGVELELFTELGAGALSGEEIGEVLGLHSRGIYDFLDTLVALGFLERTGNGGDGRYQDTADTAVSSTSEARRTSAASLRWPTRGYMGSGAI